MVTRGTANLTPEHRRLGRYEIHRQIGSGGMAEVFLALDTGTLGLDRWVAIKRIHSELAAEKRFVEMLLDEARIAARITHPHVAHVIDLGEADGSPYIVMEYLRGRSLAEVIRRGAEIDHPVEIDLLCRVVADACEGVHAAHQLRGLDGRSIGLVHRDISPHNIFVTYDGAVKVVDFGIAKALGRATRTTPGTRKGKFSYMSPEQVRGEEVDRRSDVYGLGLVLYEATTGRRVFEGVAQLDERLTRTAVDPPSRHRKSYPKSLESLIMRALADRKEDRFPTARELGQELERFIVGRRALTDPATVASFMMDLFGDADSLPGEEKTDGGTAPAPRITETRLAPPAGRGGWAARILRKLRF